MTVSGMLQKHFNISKTYVKYPEKFWDERAQRYRHRNISRHAMKYYNKIVDILYDVGDTTGTTSEIDGIVDKLDHALEEGEKTLYLN